MLSHFPGTCAVAIRLVVQRTDRTQIDDVGRQLVVDTLLDERPDLSALAAAHRAELLKALNVLREADATCAVDATRHVRRHERPQILVLHDTLAFGVARNVASETHRQILQLAFATLIADRAIER